MRYLLTAGIMKTIGDLKEALDLKLWEAVRITAEAKPENDFYGLDQVAVDVQETLAALRAIKRIEKEWAEK